MPRGVLTALIEVSDGDCEKISGGDSSPSSKNNDNDKHSLRIMIKVVLKVTVMMTPSSSKGSTAEEVHLKRRYKFLNY